MKNYYRVRVGRKNMYAEECFTGNFVGVHYDINQDLSDQLPEQVGDFNKVFIPIWLEIHPEKSKISAGHSCAMLHTLCKGILKGDRVLCPDGDGAYRVGEVTGEYSYHHGQHLPHRRAVRWLPGSIRRSDMSDSLRRAADMPRSVTNFSTYSREIEALLSGGVDSTLAATGEDVEDPTVFKMEDHLEEFMVHNWDRIPLGKEYDIFEEDGKKVGQQFPADRGKMDILAISKDKKVLLVVELKRGRTSDKVVGQVQRYMGYAVDELAEEGQTVRGVIIALEDDLGIRRALRVTQNIEFYRYEVSFALKKVDL